MTRRQSNSTWPFLCILGCLFVLSAVAPRAWERVARRQTASELLSPAKPLASAAVEVAASPISQRSPSSVPRFATRQLVANRPIADGGRTNAKAVATQGGLHISLVGAEPVVPPATSPKSGELTPSQPIVVPNPWAGGIGHYTIPGLAQLADPLRKFGGGFMEYTGQEWQLPALEIRGRQAAASAPAMPPKAEESSRDELPGGPALTMKASGRAHPAKVDPEKKLVAKAQSKGLVAGLARTPVSAATAPQVAQAPAIPKAQPTAPVIIEKYAGEAPAVPPQHAWLDAPSLQARLDRLALECDSGPWAMEVQSLMRRLARSDAKSAEFSSVVERLDRMSRAANLIAERLDDEDLAREMRRAGHALLRRTEVWQQAIRAAGPTMVTAQAQRPDPKRLKHTLAKTELTRDDSEQTSAWRKYLQIDALADLTSKPNASDDRGARHLAQRVLARLTRSGMNHSQQDFVASDSMQALASELRHWAAESVDVARMLKSIERFEESGLPSHAREVAADWRRLTFSPVESERQLAQRLESHYRNANLRIAVNENLLNRLMPPHEPEYAPVSDTILGVPVRGRSLTYSDFAVRLEPAANRLRMIFEVNGQIAAQTTSNAGPATFYNSSDSYFLARKPVEIEAQGIGVEPAEVASVNHTRLRGLQTRFDGIPVLGMIAQNIAYTQHEQNRPQAIREAERKLSARARQRIDAEAYAKLEEAVEKVRDRVFAPMNELTLRPVTIGAETTSERMTMRLRIAGDDQLGGNTPRPRAPGDALASVQVHETAVNNFLERFDLNGLSCSLPELTARVAGKLHRDAWPTDPNNDDVMITFAENDAVRVRCQDGQLVVTVAIARLSKGERAWRDFQVRVAYRPEVRGLATELVRDGVIQLIGPRLSTTSQIAVRGIFAKTFAKSVPWKIFPDSFVENPKLADLEISQFVVEDGWIGVAIGPSTTAGTVVADRRG